jgi:hypothetical protein
MSLFVDMIPDWNWRKRSNVERDGSILTVRRAVVLQSTMVLRTHLLLSLFFLWSSSQISDEVQWVVPVGLFVFFTIMFLDLDRYSAVKGPFDMAPVFANDQQRIGIALGFMMLFALLLIYVLTRETAAIWTVLDRGLESLYPVVKRFPMSALIMLAASYCAWLHLQSIKEAQDPKLDLPVSGNLEAT